MRKDLAATKARKQSLLPLVFQNITGLTAQSFADGQRFSAAFCSGAGRGRFKGD
jgi:hypothetical protein